MKKFKTLLFIFIAFKLTVLIAYLTYEHLPLQLLHFEHLATEDVQFNDIYYSTNKNKINHIEEKQVVLINAGSINKDSDFRKNLAFLINKVADCKPKTIGLDFYFDHTTEHDSLLQQTINKNNVVIAIDAKGKHKNIFTSSKKGVINFPIKTGETVREYYNYMKIAGNNIPSFANVLCDVEKEDSIAYLKYCTDYKGFYDILNPQEKINVQNFPAIEAVAILNSLDTTLFRKFIKNKIVIISHLGTDNMENAFDVEDKHRVPTNPNLFNRNLTMPGAVIHANAIQMMIDKAELFAVEGWLYELITSLILFGYLFLFYTIHHKYKLGKLFNILIILGSTIPLIFFACIYLMDLGIYYKVGSLFMQIAFLEEFIEIAEGFKRKFTKNKAHE
jgi:CHASE2 domain-containing sensor protein